MKIVQNESGKVILIYNQDEASPEGGYYLPEVIELISERYNFVKKPTIDEAQKEIKFGRGRITINGVRINIIEMVLYTDGISVTASDTDSAFAVVQDAANFATSALGIRPPKTPPSLVYENRAIVDLECQVSKALSVYNTLKDEMEHALLATYKATAPVHFIGFMVGRDPAEPVRVPRIEFSVYRRQGAPFTDSRFYCIAPFPTDTHHNMLRSLEAALLSSQGTAN